MHDNLAMRLCEPTAAAALCKEANEKQLPDNEKHVKSAFTFELRIC
jgi:hypothetical protein